MGGLWLESRITYVMPGQNAIIQLRISWIMTTIDYYDEKRVGGCIAGTGAKRQRCLSKESQAS